MPRTSRGIIFGVKGCAGGEWARSRVGERGEELSYCCQGRLFLFTTTAEDPRQTRRIAPKESFILLRNGEYIAFTCDRCLGIFINM